MKKNYFMNLFVTLMVALLCMGCGSKLTIDKCEDMISSHPFIGERHVGVSKEKLEGCDDAYAGCVKNGYILLRGGSVDAHHYYMNGFGVKDVCDLVIEESRAECKFDLIETERTSAYDKIKDHRIGDDTIPCKAYFIKTEKGWKLDDIMFVGKSIMINVWEGDKVKPYVNFSSYE